MHVSLVIKGGTLAAEQRIFRSSCRDTGVLPAKLLPGINSNPTSEQVYLITRLEPLDTRVF